MVMLLLGGLHIETGGSSLRASIGTVCELHVTGDECEGLLLQVSGVPVDRGDRVGALSTMDGREMPMMPRRAIAERWLAVKTPRSSVIVDRPSSLRTVLVQIERTIQTVQLDEYR